MWRSIHEGGRITTQRTMHQLLRKSPFCGRDRKKIPETFEGVKLAVPAGSAKREKTCSDGGNILTTVRVIFGLKYPSTFVSQRNNFFTQFSLSMHRLSDESAFNRFANASTQKPLTAHPYWKVKAPTENGTQIRRYTKKICVIPAFGILFPLRYSWKVLENGNSWYNLLSLYCQEVEKSGKIMARRKTLQAPGCDKQDCHSTFI